MGFPDGTVVKESASQCRGCGFDPWVGKIPWSRKGQTTPVSIGFPRATVSGVVRSQIQLND